MVAAHPGDWFAEQRERQRLVPPLGPDHEAVRVFSEEHRRLVREGIDPLSEPRVPHLNAFDRQAHGLPPLSLPSHNVATAQPPPLASERRILDRFKGEVRSRGLVGEERNATVLYLVLTSRLLERQVSAGLKGHSSSGKSYMVETVVEFFPDDAVVVFTAMSEKALIYSKRDFRHRTLVIYEITALREGVEDDLTSYFVRTLLSEGRLDYEVTVRQKDGNFSTKRIEKEGPTNLVFTTTKTKVHPENETRILTLHSDDSTEQIKRVLAEIASEGNGKRDLVEWRQLQTWLADAEHRVTIPYAKAVAEQVPPIAVRLRRDFGSLLSLIKAHAMLHQQNRCKDDRGQIIATTEDYAVVRELIADVISDGLEATVPGTVRATVTAVEALKNDGGVMARAIAEHLHIDKSNASRRLRMAADGGYVRNLEDRRGKPARWVLGDPLPEDVAVLPEPAALNGCAVARADQGGKSGDLFDTDENNHNQENQ